MANARDERDAKIASLIRTALAAEIVEAKKQARENDPYFRGVVDAMRKILAYVDPEPWK